MQCWTAKGFSQMYGIDYDQTFSPIAKFESLRLLLALAVQNGLTVHQRDVTTAFLNGTLEEEVYMDQPEEYVENRKEKLVCRLNHSQYGLKQAP
uniref:Reverse transcriptase Ty1/copia-type domain-containing protein n=1 Tax=Amphimedon queenslandica TaxID=400682 RepID=A0A1X7TG71_AMPQE